jgi:hypothetical protein
MSKPTNETPETPAAPETDKDELREEELEQAAGGIIVQGMNPQVLKYQKVPAITGPILPGKQDLLL